MLRKSGILWIGLSLLTCFIGIKAQPSVPLKFHADSTFKIVQFTDLHVVWEDHRSDPAFNCIQKVIAAEKPDLVVVTGDIIYSPPADKNLTKVLKTISDTHTPFVITFGNHDRQQGLPNATLLKIAMQNPYCLNSNAEGISGEGNCALTIRSGTAPARDAAVLYCIDSHENSQLEDVGVKGYDFIARDQIAWYVNTSEAFTRANSGKPLPSLAFFHIPLPEYHQAASDENAQFYGIRREKACSPELNTGMFAAMKGQKDIMGIFVGHDHDNDYAVIWYDIVLAYGRFSGGPTEYNHLPNGARVIRLHENERRFDSWIHPTNGTIEQYITYPDSFIKK